MKTYVKTISLALLFICNITFAGTLQQKLNYVNTELKFLSEELQILNTAPPTVNQRVLNHKKKILTEQIRFLQALRDELTKSVPQGGQTYKKIFWYPTYQGYRLDWCRKWAVDCGKGAADAFCRLKGYKQAIRWEIDPDIGATHPTKIISTGQICNQAPCDGFKFIECGNPRYPRNSDVEFNTDRMGMDYKNFDLPFADYRLCQKACEREKRCKAWTYVKPNTIQGPHPRCWLKYAVPSPTKSNCCISGVKKAGKVPPSSGNSRVFVKPRLGNYRLDWCKTWGTNCGKPAADAFCRLHGYKEAIRWEMDPDIGATHPTKIISTGQICNQAPCDGFKFIECGNPTKISTTSENQYIGCYKDQGDPYGLTGRDLNGYIFQSKDMTPQKCITLCSQRGFKYAGVQYSRFCFCGNSYGKYGVAKNCNMRCSGDPNQICGGSWANSVYSTTVGHGTGRDTGYVENNNLIKNGSFELGSQYVGNWKTLSKGSNEINNWIITKGSVDLIENYWQSSDGKRSIDLCGSTWGAISQNINTISGNMYKLTFDMAGNPDNQGIKYLKVIAGTTSRIFQFDTRGKNKRNMGWVKKSLIFRATSNITNISFIALDNNPYAWGPALDNVKVIELSGKTLRPINVAGKKISNYKGCITTSDKQGNLYAAEYKEGRIVKIDKSGKVSVYVTGIDRPRYPVFDDEGNLYVGSYDGNIYKITPDKKKTVIARAIWSPQQMGFDAKGNLYVAGAYDGKIYKITPYKRAYVVATGFNQPNLLAVEDDGSLYIVDTKYNRSKIIKVSSRIKRVFASFDERINGIALYNGNLYVSHSDKVSKITVGKTSTVVSKLNKPRCLVFYNNRLFVSTLDGIIEVNLKEN